jgi:hypothetical protein
MTTHAEESPSKEAHVDAPQDSDLNVEPTPPEAVAGASTAETLSSDVHTEECGLDVEATPLETSSRSGAVETLASSLDTEAGSESVTAQEAPELAEQASSQDEVRSESFAAQETPGLAEQASSEDEARSEDEGVREREAPAQQQCTPEDDEVVLESSFIPSSPSAANRQAVRESTRVDSNCAREAAMMLQCLPPLEAARLALSMEDEERLAAFSYMSHEDRAAVIAGMPFDTAVAAGLMDPCFDADMEELLSDEGEDEGGCQASRSKKWPRSLASSARVGNIGSRARGAASSAASSMRHGLTQAVEKGRTVEMPAKVTEYGGKVSGAATRTAGLAKEKMLQAAEKAKVSAEKSKVSELGGRAIDIAGSAARRAKEATVKAAPSSTGEAKEKAKEKVAVAADTASNALSSMSKGFASMMKRPSQQKSSP